MWLESFQWPGGQISPTQFQKIFRCEETPDHEEACSDESASTDTSIISLDTNTSAASGKVEEHRENHPENFPPGSQNTVKHLSVLDGHLTPLEKSPICGACNQDEAAEQAASEIEGNERCKAPHRCFVDLVTQGNQTWPTENEKVLLGPYDYVLQQPGKDVRGRFISALNQLLRVPENKLDIIASVVSMLHTSSLLIDDIEDSSTLRRGAPVAHSIFGCAQTINSANYVYVLALEEAFKLGNPAAVHIYGEELLNLHRGQGMELFWRETLRCPSEGEYLEMIRNKTGGLFRLAGRLMQAESPVESNCVPLLDLIGVIFQICDDYVNLQDTKYGQTKVTCEDLTEGKFSFPMIHGIREKPDDQLLLNVLRQRTTDDTVKRHAVRYLRDCGSFVYTRKVIAQLYQKATEMVDDLEENHGERFGGPLKAILQGIVKATLSEGEDQVMG
ncbi:MAG: hypothetical protein Q9218_005134 [Villophora microphyllina]